MGLPEMPVLTRSPVVLRAFAAQDADLVRSVADDPLITLITTVPTSGTLPDALAFIERQHDLLASGSAYSFAITDEATGEPVGAVGLGLRDLASGRASGGYWLGAAYRRRGYAVAALDAISRWGLSLDGVHRIELRIEPWNEASWRAAERVGYVREGLMRSWLQIGTERRDLYLYSLLPADLPAPATASRPPAARGPRCCQNDSQGPTLSAGAGVTPLGVSASGGDIRRVRPGPVVDSGIHPRRGSLASGGFGDPPSDSGVDSAIHLAIRGGAAGVRVGPFGAMLAAK